MIQSSSKVTKKEEYHQMICFGGIKGYKERCYLKGIFYGLAVKLLKREMPGLKVHLKYLTIPEFIQIKKEKIYRPLFKHHEGLTKLVKEEFDVYMKHLKTIKSNRAPRILEKKSKSKKIGKGHQQVKTNLSKPDKSNKSSNSIADKGSVNKKVKSKTSKTISKKKEITVNNKKPTVLKIKQKQKSNLNPSHKKPKSKKSTILKIDLTKKIIKKKTGMKKLKISSLKPEPHSQKPKSTLKKKINPSKILKYSEPKKLKINKILPIPKKVNKLTKQTYSKRKKASEKNTNKINSKHKKKSKINNNQKSIKRKSSSSKPQRNGIVERIKQVGEIILKQYEMEMVDPFIKNLFKFKKFSAIYKPKTKTSIFLNNYIDICKRKGGI